MTYTEAKEILKKMLKVYVHEPGVKEALIIAIKSVAEKEYYEQELIRLRNKKKGESDDNV